MSASGQVPRHSQPYSSLVFKMDSAHTEMYNRLREHSMELDMQIEKLRKISNEAGSLIDTGVNHASRIAQNEDRLHELLQRFNHTVSSNSELKENIDLLRKEKTTFESIRDRMIQEIDAQTVASNSIVDKSKAAYAARDNAKSQMDQLKQQADREHAEFQKEWLELAKLLENDKRMREFAQQREIHKQIQKKAPVKSIMDDVPPKPAANHSQRSHTKESRKQELESLFSTLQNATGITTLDELLQFFVEKDKSNYSLYALSSLNLKQIDLLQTRINYTNSEIDRFRNSTHSSITLPGYQYLDARASSDSSSVGVLEHNLMAAEREADELEKQSKSLTKLIASIRSIVQSCSRKVFPNISDSVEYLSQSVIASSAGQSGIALGQVTDTNLVDYLASIERRVDELAEVMPKLMSASSSLTKKSFTMRASQRKSVLALPTAAGVNAGNVGNPIVMNRILQYKLPSAMEDEEESINEPAKFRDDLGVDSTRPLTREELRNRTLLTIQKNQDKLKVKKSLSKVT